MMLVVSSHAAVQSAANARVALVLLAVGVAVFWRIALRILLAIAVVALAVGTLVLLHGVTL